VYLVSAGAEAVLSPLLGRFSDRRGRRLPLLGACAGAAVVTALLPWPEHRFVLAVVVFAAGVAFGSFWAPAMSQLSDVAEAQGLDHGFAFALVNLAWAPGQALGASGGGSLADLTSDTVPYLVLSGASLLTLAALWRSRSSS
nr:MFS transporter [Actinomycetota bacterium]